MQNPIEKSQTFDIHAILQPYELATALSIDAGIIVAAINKQPTHSNTRNGGCAAFMTLFFRLMMVKTRNPIDAAIEITDNVRQTARTPG